MFEKRIQKLANLLKQRNIEVSIIIQNADLYYFTGSVFQGTLIVQSDGSYKLLIIKPWSRVLEESPLENKIRIKTIKQLPDFLSDFSKATLGMELDVIPWSIVEKIKQNLSVDSVKDISPIIRKIRSVKEEYEITQIQKAADILSDTFIKIPDWIHSDLTELELAANIESFMRKKGHQGYIRVRRYDLELYYGALGIGKSVCSPTLFDGPVGTPGLYAATPFFAGKKQIKKGDTILVDIMAGVEGYLCDATRTYSLGQPSEKIIKAHNVALEIQESLRADLKPDVIPEKLYEQSLKITQKYNLTDSFMGYKENKVKFVGHGLGLEIDELPVIAPRFVSPLKKNNVLAIEPKFFFGNEATGIENTFVVTENGGENLVSANDDIYII